MRFAFLFPRFKILSGAERLILKLASALAESGHEIHIASHQFDDSCRPLLADGVHVRVSGVRLDYFHNRYLNAAFDYFRGGRLLNGLPDSLDAVCCFGPALTAAADVRRSTRAPVMYFCYEPPRFLYTDRDLIRQALGAWGIVSGPVFAAYRRRDRRMVREVSGVLSNSEFGRKQIQEVYGRDAHVITHGIDAFRPGTQRNEIRRRFQFQDEDVVILTVNYLHPRKRIDLFIDAVRKAHAQDPAIRGLVVGDGPERARLQNSGGEAVSFTGFIPEGELHEYYQAADVYLHTGRLETFGLSVIEAAGNRLPVVSVNEGGPADSVLDGRTGYLRDSNADSLSSALRELTASAAKRAELGNNGFEYVRKTYRWSRGAEDFLAAVRAVKRLE